MKCKTCKIKYKRKQIYCPNCGRKYYYRGSGLMLTIAILLVVLLGSVILAALIAYRNNGFILF